MKIRTTSLAMLLVTLCFGPIHGSLNTANAQQPTTVEVTAAMRSAAEFYRSRVASHGGYLYFYSLDLQQRFGEGVASGDQIWVQPPGTPTVGMAYLKAFKATADPYYLDAATEAAEALMYGQLDSGAWTNCIDFDPQGQRVALYRNGKGRGRNHSSLDDDQSQAAIRFLMRCDRAHQFKHQSIHQAVTIALDALLAAQFNNGAFPQGWDKPVARDQPIIAARFPEYDWRTEGRIKNYWDMYTLNDDLASSVAQVLIEAHQIYADERYKASLAKLGDFLLLAQMPNPQPAWSQQYSYQMHPIWARKFEPPAIAGDESQDVLEALLKIFEHTGDIRYLIPVPEAIAYLKRSQLPGAQLARFYELQTNRPLYMKRAGNVYSLSYEDDQLPDHYGWKGKSRLEAIEKRYQALVQGTPLPMNRQDADDLANSVTKVLRTLDAQGRWISTYQGERLVGNPKFRPGDHFLSSAVFSANLELLSEYLQ